MLKLSRGLFTSNLSVRNSLRILVLLSLLMAIPSFGAELSVEY